MPRWRVSYNYVADPKNGGGVGSVVVEADEEAEARDRALEASKRDDPPGTEIQIIGAERTGD